MNDTLRLAWRNLGRNRRRTAATIAAIACGTALSALAIGVLDGLSKDVLTQTVRLSTGHVQIHHPRFAELGDLGGWLEDGERLMEQVATSSAVVAFSPRAYGSALVRFGDAATGASLVGIIPDQENLWSNLRDKLTEGDFVDDRPTPWPAGRTLSADEQTRDDALTEAAVDKAMAALDALGTEHDTESDKPSAALAGSETRELVEALAPPPERAPRVMIGEGLSRTLGARVGDHLELAAQAVDGSPEDLRVEVAGIFRTGNETFDRGRIYLHLADLGRLLHTEHPLHEIVIYSNDIDNADILARQFGESLTAGGSFIVRPWQRVRPDIARSRESSRVFTGVMTFFILLIAAFGVINTTLMTVLERTREFGLLRALGMQRGRILGLIMCETLLLVFFAALVGAVVGWLANHWLSDHGIDLSGWFGEVKMAGLSINPILRPDVSLRGIILPVTILTATCLVGALFPASRAASIQPAEGLRPR